MPSCAACQTPFTKERRGLKCTLCDERRVAEPAYYCDRSCQKRHWPEHKAFHERLVLENQTVKESYHLVYGTRENLAPVEDHAASSDRFISLLGQAEQARHRGEFREAVKRAKKAIALEPALPGGYFYLAMAYAESGDFNNAVPQFLKTVECTDKGTEWNRQYGDENWAMAASSAFTCLGQCDDALKPAWYTDTQQLKRMAHRAVAALPEDFYALQMRILAYQRTPIEIAPVDEIRQLLSDVRGLLASIKEGNAVHESNLRFAAHVEAELRKRIAADLAALKLADD